MNTKPRMRWFRGEWTCRSGIVVGHGATMLEAWNNMILKKYNLHKKNIPKGYWGAS